MYNGAEQVILVLLFWDVDNGHSEVNEQNQ